MAGVDRYGRPLLRALERRFGEDLGALGLRPKDLDPHGLAGVAVLLRRAAHAAVQGRLAPGDERAAAMLDALEHAADRVEEALDERIVAAIVRARTP